MRTPLLFAILLAACADDATQRSYQPSTASDSGSRSDDEHDEDDDGDDDDDDDDPSEDESTTRMDAGDPAPRDAGSDASILTGPCAPGSESLVETLGITELALYQSVKIPLFADGEWVSDRPAPVVQGKDALVRMFVEPLRGYSAHEVQGVLTLTNGSDVTRLEAKLTPRAASLDEELESSFNFQVPAAALGTDTEISAAVVEVKCDPKRKPNPRARLPETDSRRLEPTKVGALRLVVIPVRNGTFLPDTSASAIEGLRAAFSAHYPVPTVEVRVAPVLPWNYAVTSSGQGWSDLLNAITRQRQRDNVSSDVYYLGLVAPARQRSDFCTGGCVAGLAPLNLSGATGDQVGLSLGFGGQSTYSSAVHEIGHAHGRPHAPCGGASQADGRYPYRNGVIGGWGWDARSQELIAPIVADFMGYCEPQWISDYTYAALAERSLAVNTSALIEHGETATSSSASWVRLIVYGDGKARWAGLATHDAPPGARVTLRVFGADDELVAQVSAARTQLDHSNESFVDIPEPQADWSAIELDGLRLQLSKVLPAR